MLLLHVPVSHIHFYINFYYVHVTLYIYECVKLLSVIKYVEKFMYWKIWNQQIYL